MSVTQQLGLDGPGGGLPAQAHRWWAAGAREHPGLAVVGDLAELPGWLAAAPPAARDEVLGALSGVAAADDAEAASAAAVVLVWLLAPGACLLAHRLREVSAEVDALVAGQLWIEVRTFGPARGRRVAASILWNTRNAVLREVGVGIHSEPAWAHRVALEPAHPAWERLPAPRGGAGRPGQCRAGCARGAGMRCAGGRRGGRGAAGGPGRGRSRRRAYVPGPAPGGADGPGCGGPGCRGPGGVGAHGEAPGPAQRGRAAPVRGHRNVGLRWPRSPCRPPTGCGRR